MFNKLPSLSAKENTHSVSEAQLSATHRVFETRFMDKDIEMHLETTESCTEPLSWSNVQDELVQILIQFPLVTLHCRFVCWIFIHILRALDPLNIFR